MLGYLITQGLEVSCWVVGHVLCAGYKATVYVIYGPTKSNEKLLEEQQIKIDLLDEKLNRLLKAHGEAK